jgi:signal peptidase I
MWIVEKYVKYLLGFGILWGLLAAYRTCGCAKVQGAYMQPTLISDQFVTVMAGKNKPGQVKQGDIVWFWFKVPNSREDGYLARVIGMPGDRVAIKAGNIVLNGTALSEPYEKPETMNASLNLPEVVVPNGTYFLLCDNRRDANAPDSRRFGPISDNSVWGKIRQ